MRNRKASLTRREALHGSALGVSGVVLGVAATAPVAAGDNPPQCFALLKAAANNNLAALDFAEDGKEKQAARKAAKAAEFGARLDDLGCVFVFFQEVDFGELDQPCISILRAGFNRVLAGIRLHEAGREEQASEQLERAEEFVNSRPECGMEIRVGP